MRWIRGVVLGTLLGAAAGCAVGFMLAGNSMVRAFIAWSTFWRDCGPHLFIPLWMGAAIGCASPLKRDSVGGVLLTVAAGMAAGLFAHALHLRVFGAPFVVTRGFASLPQVLPLLLLFCGGLAALVWRFVWDRIGS